MITEICNSIRKTLTLPGQPGSPHHGTRIWHCYCFLSLSPCPSHPVCPRLLGAQPPGDDGAATHLWHPESWRVPSLTTEMVRAWMEPRAGVRGEQLTRLCGGGWAPAGSLEQDSSSQGMHPKAWARGGVNVCRGLVAGRGMGQPPVPRPPLLALLPLSGREPSCQTLKGQPELRVAALGRQSSLERASFGLRESTPGGTYP